MFLSTPETGAGKNLTPYGMTHAPESGVKFMALYVAVGTHSANC